MGEIKFVEGFNWTREQVLGLVADAVGADWEIYNTSRPLPGDVSWSNPEYGRCGWFYAAIDPGGADAERLRKRCRELDGRLCVWVTMAEAREWAEMYYEPEIVKGRLDLSKFDDEAIARSYLLHSRKEG